MTIICYRDGVMAADSASTSDGIRVGSARKIVRMLNGGLAAGGGRNDNAALFRAWAAGPRTEPLKLNEGEFAGLIVEPDGAVMDVFRDGSVVPYDAPFAVQGCAWQVAFGAMAAGACAVRAVEIAIQYSDGCYGPVQTECLV